MRSRTRCLTLRLLASSTFALIYAAIGANYFAGVQSWPFLVLFITAMSIYAMTLAPITWVAFSEIFPGEARGASMALAATALWSACFLLTYTSPFLNAAAGTGWNFWLYSLICMTGFIFIFRALPETKGKSLEQIKREWRWNRPHLCRALCLCNGMSRDCQRVLASPIKIREAIRSRIWHEVYVEAGTQHDHLFVTKSVRHPRIARTAVDIYPNNRLRIWHI